MYRCPLHSALDDDASEDLEEEQGNEKENVPVISAQTINVSRAKVAKVSAKATKGAEYGAKDLLILSQAFIRTSENDVESTAKQRNKFWDEVAISYSALKKQQEAYDNRQQKQKKYYAVLLRGEFLSSDDDNDDSDVELVLPVQTASSLQQKWSKFVLPIVTKFICLTNRHPKKVVKVSLLHSFVLFLMIFCSHYIVCFYHLDNDRYYNRIHLIFLQQNPNINSFDIYRPS